MVVESLRRLPQQTNRVQCLPWVLVSLLGVGMMFLGQTPRRLQESILWVVFEAVMIVFPLFFILRTRVATADWALVWVSVPHYEIP
jgi:hypothetical protein